MVNSVEISIRADLPGCPVFLRVNGEVAGIYDFGLKTRRISWLPSWVPFNSYIDTTLTARAEFMKILNFYGQTLAKNMSKAA